MANWIRVGNLASQQRRRERWSSFLRLYYFTSSIWILSGTNWLQSIKHNLRICGQTKNEHLHAPTSSTTVGVWDPRTRCSSFKSWSEFTVPKNKLQPRSLHAANQLICLMLAFSLKEVWLLRWVQCGGGKRKVRKAGRTCKAARCQRNPSAPKTCCNSHLVRYPILLVRPHCWLNKLRVLWCPSSSLPAQESFPKPDSEGCRAKARALPIRQDTSATKS